MKLYFIRHGKAGYNATTDEARPLTEAGIQQAKNNGLILKAMGVTPAKIYSSPRLRAQQTAEHIGQALNIEVEINEASLGRVYQHITRDASKSFAILTAFRGGNSKQQNLQRNKKLQSDVRSLGLGFFKVKGYWVYNLCRGGQF